MFKVIDLGPEGKPQESDDADLVAPPAPGRLRWIDLIRADPSSLDLLRRRFNFHPLALEDCASFDARSKFDEYADHLFLVLHSFSPAPEDPSLFQVHEIHAFLGESYLVTVHDNRVPATEEVWRRAATDATVLRRGTSWALYMTVDAMIDATFPVLDLLMKRVENVEELVLSDARRRTLGDIFTTRSTLVSLRRVMRPVRDVVGVLTRRAEPPLSERTALYFRDIQDHVLRCLETMDEAEQLIANTIDAHRSAVATRTNEIMAKLTIFSAIFLPLGFIVGFWGQNFHSLPFGSSGTMVALSLVLCVVVPVVLLTWFWWKRWL
ncbi:MAG TPA: magnesium transporter CorA family protein [Kofleriaceae bacterium]|nr:magnesium transporter CorA family protein [Kofleriaceae bacterium]